MAPPLSGSWMRANAAIAAMHGPSPTVNPRHSTDERVEGVRAETIADASGPIVPAGTDQDAATAGYIAATPAAPGRVDQTPTKAHDTVDASPSAPMGQHAAKLGAHLRLVTLPRQLVWGDAYPEVAQKDHDSPPHTREGSGRLWAIRGLNSFPENNPPRGMFSTGSTEHTGEGWRRGVQLWRRGEHNLALPQRRYRSRVIFNHGAKVESDIPPVGTVYGSPFASLTRAIPRNFAMPRMRRSPGRIDEDIITDGYESPAGQEVGTFI